MRFDRAPGERFASAFLVLMLAAASALLAPALARAQETDLRAELDGLFEETWRPGEPGAAVLVTRGDEVVLRKAYGMADLELGVPIAPDMVFRLGSITKQFTGAATLLLVESGELSLDATLGEVLPDYDGPAARVTVHQLLTHTAGVPSYTEPEEYRDRMREDVTPEAMMERFRDEPLEFEPGTEWKYSNSGYFLLGAVIEERSETSYEDFVESRIFEPLGMHRTRYGRVVEIVPGRVEGYQGEDAANDDATRVVTREGDQLFTQRTGGSKSPVSFSAEDRFFYAERLTSGRFARDEDGRVTGMWMHQSVGPDEWAVKTDRPLPEEPEEVAIDPAILDRYPGRYQLSPGFWIDVTREGEELFVQATGQPKLRILPESETRFFLEEVDAALEFHGAEGGRADSLTLFQAGQEMQGERIEE